MTKTEAAEIVGRKVRVSCRNNEKPVTKQVIEEIMGEWANYHSASLLGQAATVANWRTVLAWCHREAKLMGETS
jgi:hypothetical protein